MSSTQHFKLLYVCSGNTARSPLAAACTRSIVASNGDGDVRWVVSSAGTQVVDGDPVRPEILRVTNGFGVDLSGHQPVVLTEQLCRDSDLVLGMSWDQVSHIWSLVPDAWGRCFTVKEFVHWAKQAPGRPPILFPNRVEAIRDKVSQAHAVRQRARADHGFWGGLRPQDLNLVEPDGKGDAAWRNLAQAVRVLVTDAVRLLDGPGVASGAR